MYHIVSLLVIVLLATHMSASVAFLQGGGGTWDTGVNVQNLGTEAATTSFQFYDLSGTLVHSDTVSIDPGGNVNIYVPSIADGDLPAGRYSMVVSSSEPVAAVANNVNRPSKIGDSYLASNPGSTEAYLPLIYRNYHSYTSIIYAQNATGSSQDIIVYLYNVGSSTPAVSKTYYDVSAYGSQEIDLASSDFSAFGDTFGSAVLTGVSGDIAVMVGYVKNPGLGANRMINGEYRGIPPSLAGTTLLAPLVYKNHNSWDTGISVQNTQSINTTVTITYTASSSCVHYPLVVTDTKELGPDSSINFYLPSNPDLPAGFFGGALLSSSDANILAISNSVKYGVPTGDVASGYEAFNPSTTATDKIAAPLIYRAHADTETGINLLNAGDVSTDITVTITKSPNSNPTGPGSPGPWLFTQTGVGPGEAVTFYLPSLMPDVSGLYGSAEITSTGSVPIVGVMSAARYPAGISANYTGINY